MASVRVPVALSIAGSDPSGGAGVQADLKTFAALGVHGAAALTALTAQNTREVRAVHELPPEFVVAQVEAVLDDLEVGATKLGMLASAPIVRALAACLRARGVERLVVDPVMVSKGGARLLRDDAVEALRTEILPLATVATPNLPEAAVLLGVAERDVRADPQGACRRLAQLGPRAVVLKGGHAGGSYSEDLLWDGRELLRLPARRIATENTHGTGCTFSAAIAALLARGADLHEAAGQAKAYVTAALEGAREWRVGGGHGPVHHFHAWWPEPPGS